MLMRAIHSALDEGLVSPEDFVTFSDEELLTKMSSGTAGMWVQGLTKRQLYKEAFTFSLASKVNTAKLERDLSERFSCDVIISKPPELFKPVSIRVATEDGIKPLASLSDLIVALERSGEKRQKILVLAPAEKRDKIHAYLLNR